MIAAALSASCIRNLKNDSNLACTCNGYFSTAETDNITIKCDFPAKTLEIQNSEIRFLNANFLGKLRPQLENLIFDSIGLKYLEYSGLNGHEIKNISFKNNSLQEISSLTISTLEVLHFEFNKIVDVSTFTNSMKLKEIYLSFNRIYDISAETFKALRFLKVLKLDHNQLTKIPARLFKQNYDLEYIDLSSNFIARIDQDFFKALPENFEFRMTENPCLLSTVSIDYNYGSYNRKKVPVASNAIILVRNGITTQLMQDLKNCINIQMSESERTGIQLKRLLEDL